MSRCTDTAFRILNCCFLPEFLDMSLRGEDRLEPLIAHPTIHFGQVPLRASPTAVTFHDDGELRPVFERMFDEFASHRYGCIEIIRSCLIFLLITSLRQISADSLPAIGHDLTRRIIVYIETHTSAHCTLEDAAAALRYSQIHT